MDLRALCNPCRCRLCGPPCIPCRCRGARPYSRKGLRAVDVSPLVSVGVGVIHHYDLRQFASRPGCGLRQSPASSSPSSSARTALAHSNPLLCSQSLNVSNSQMDAAARISWISDPPRRGNPRMACNPSVGNGPPLPPGGGSRFDSIGIRLKRAYLPTGCCSALCSLVGMLPPPPPAAIPPGPSRYPHHTTLLAALTAAATVTQ
uniref:Uncharacterized protein n=1 Tax=uncultured marine virus TaxID=186617 RepID=A0A0F7L6J9_9VIRU|nr:hypothetical protein [uncultured marine virus]